MLFKSRGKVNINSVHIPDPGWERIKNESSIIQWVNPGQTVAVSKNFFDLPPDLPTLSDLGRLREFYEHAVSAAKGGVLQVETIHLKKIVLVKTLIKLPQAPSGLTYVAALTIPFKSCSFVIKVQAAEVGDTGIRHALLMEKAEEEQYDAQFPNHPLSLARIWIARLEKEITFEPVIDRLHQIPN